MYIVCFDLEGVFTPEVWITVAEKTKIPDLCLTTRDISDYNVLMQQRLKILKKNDIKLSDIQKIIHQMEPLPGAKDFLNWIRSKVPIILLSDTFQEFGMIFMEKLGYPPLFCHNLVVDEHDFIQDYKIRINNQKAETVDALQKLNYQIIAAGDSYNDITMLETANHGILFRPPENVVKEYPDFPIANDYGTMKQYLEKWIGSD